MSELKNKIIISTQPNESFTELNNKLLNSGAFLFHYPMIEVEQASITENEKEILKKLDFDWLVFTSKNGVKYFFNILKDLNITHKTNLPKIAVIGKKTAIAVENFSYKATFISESNLSETFANELKNKVISKNQKVIVLLGNLANNNIENSLKDYASVVRVNCYNTIPTKNDYPDLIQKISSNKYDLILFSSSSCFINLAELLIRNNVNLKNLKAASIGKATTETINKYNIAPILTATESNINGLINEVKNYYKLKN